MATKAGSIYTEIRARLDKYERDLAKAHGITTKGADRIQRRINKISFSKATASMAQFSRSFMKLQGLFAIGFAGFSIGKVAASFLDVAASFEQMEVKLDALTKGQGKKTLEDINAWALKMPVNTKAAVDSFVLMKAMGLDPTIKKMQILTDVASIFGDDVLKRVSLQLGQASAKGRLMAQDLNILAEAGINARKYIKEAFGLTLEELQKSSISIEEQISAVFNGMEREFGGASQRMMNSWRGLKAVTESYFTEIARKLMDQGIFDALKTKLSEVNEQMKAWIDTNSEFLSQDLPRAIITIADAVGNLTVALAKTITLLTDNKVWAAVKAASSQFTGSVEPWAELMKELEAKEKQFWEDRAANRIRGKMPEQPTVIRKKIPGITTDTKDAAAAAALREQEQQVKALTDAYVAALPVIKTYRDSWEVKGERTFTDEQIDKAAQLNNAFESLKNAAIDEELAEAFGDINETAKTTFEGLTQLSERTAWAMQDNFSNLFFDAMKVELKSFNDYAMAIFDSIQRAAADIAAQKLTESLFGGIATSAGGGWLAGLFGGGGGGGGGNIATIRGGQGGGYGFQHGGYIGEPVKGIGLKTGSSYEFHPHEVVTPVGKGGGGTAVTVNNYSGQPATVAENTDTDGLRRIVIDIAKADVMRGGQLAQSMGQTFGLARRGRIV